MSRKRNKTQQQNNTQSETPTSSQENSESNVSAAFEDALNNSDEASTAPEEIAPKKTVSGKINKEEVKRKTPGKYRKFI